MTETFRLPDPASDPELFDGLLTRRVIAYFIDLVIISMICLATFLVGGILGLLTLGLGWLATPLLMVLAVIGYYAATLGSAKRATVGMYMMDLVLTPTHGLPLDGWRAFAHPLVFWVTCWILPPFSCLVALFTPRRQMLHDLLVGTLIVRRSPMQAHWAGQRSAY